MGRAVVPDPFLPRPSSSLSSTIFFVLFLVSSGVKVGTPQAVVPGGYLCE